MNQWLLIRDCNALPNVVNHGVLHLASGCESWRVILSQWLLIIVFIVEQVVVNHVVLF